VRRTARQESAIGVLDDDEVERLRALADRPRQGRSERPLGVALDEYPRGVLVDDGRTVGERIRIGFYRDTACVGDEGSELGAEQPTTSLARDRVGRGLDASGRGRRR
jgi:hypothetical protein